MTADDLHTTMLCEFCGETFSMALSHALTKPEWRYRLAAHLREDQVQSMMPALAVTSLLRQFRHVEEPSFPLVLGLEIILDGAKCEVDVAAYIPDPDWLAVLGEVKTSNRIGATDIENIERVEARLAQNGVRSLALFATLKDNFTPEELSVLRERVERSRLTTSARGQTLPGMPLVLTGPDLSHAADDEEHPWRWDNENYSGLLGTAITSCKRNLGLLEYRVEGRGVVSYEWLT